jgi:hydroxymethylglutaryl-CoA reductase (NADPH)
VRDVIAQRIIDVVARYARRQVEDITENTLLREDLGFDSMVIVEILFDIESLLGTSVQDEWLQECRTVGNVIEAVKREFPDLILKLHDKQFSTSNTPAISFGQRKQGITVDADNRRITDRQTVKIPVCIKMSDGEVSCLTKDISPAGFSLISNMALSPGITVNLRFLLREGTDGLNLLGQVVFCLATDKDVSGRYVIGMKFHKRAMNSSGIRSIVAEPIKLNGMTKNTLANSESKWVARKGTEPDLIPRHSTLDYTTDFIATRRNWISQKTGIDFKHIQHFSLEPNEVRGNIESFIGVGQVPIGVVGPLQIDGASAKGTFYVPFATTEGGIVTTFQRGAIAITKAGGAKTFIHSDENHLAPVFHLKNLREASEFAVWVNENLSKMEKIVSEYTFHGKLLRITPCIIGRRVILDFAYTTADAMGANLINILTEECCEFISKATGVSDYFLRSNFTSEKKASGAQLVVNCGKSVTAEVILPRKIVERYLGSSPDSLSKGWHTWALASVHAGMLGFNAHFANGLSAMFIACGQDIAHVTNGSVGLTMFETVGEGDLYAAVKLPNIIVGTVGGATALPTQRECLQMIGCYGKGKAKKLAEIIGATLLAGELGICAGITSKDFQRPHKIARAYTRAKAFEQIQGE